MRLKIEIQPIGVIRNDAGRRRPGEWKGVISTLVLDEEYTAALYRLDEYSHIEVLFHLDQMDRPFQAKIHPLGDPENPLMGAFATRTPNRPSRIALTTVKVLSIEGNKIHVEGLDAFDGSPLLDIKPHFERNLEGVRTPEWRNEKKPRSA
jgi:tRNA-Thr(GGU) m(6)t(6)A37 methyltransferase TsaA